MLQKFLDHLYSDLFDTAHDPENGGLRLNALLQVLLNRLDESGIVPDGQVAYFLQELPNLVGEAHGYAYDAEEDFLILFYCVDANEDTALGDPITVQPTAKDRIDRSFRRLEGFLKLVRTGKVAEVEESQPAYEMVELVRESTSSGRAIVFSVLTTGTVSEKAAISAPKDGISREVWDLTRLVRTCGGTGDDKLSINFAEEFHQILPCLVTKPAADGIQVLFTCIPGTLLAPIYNTFRARLLERNVRSFLQFTGKVNKGIRETLISSPARFLPYNNGLSATASKVDLQDVKGETAQICSVHDFQIVNGGQTTASIAAAARRGEVDLSQVTVAMKLTIIPREKVDQLVPLISKYANTQNRIQEADFSANHPWHVELQQISRATWTQPSADSPRGTRWFYERARGQYADEVAAQNTPAGKRRFRSENPSPQKFTKTDLAKFVLSWDQRPAIVSRGAQKCFMEFMNQLMCENRRPPTADDFRRTIAQAILFHTAERLYGELGFHGFRAQVVTYSIARLSHALQRRLPWEEMWETQRVSDDLIQPLKTTLIGVREVVTVPPSKWRNVTEWCKRDECWSAVLERQLDLGLPEPTVLESSAGGDSNATQLSASEQAVVEAVSAVPRKVWMAVSKWAKETQSLLPWQRAIAFSIGRRIGSGAKPSPKQAKQGRILLLESHRFGFAHPLLTNELIERVRLSETVS